MHMFTLMIQDNTNVADNIIPYIENSDKTDIYFDR